MKTFLKICSIWYSYCFINSTITGYLYGKSEAVTRSVDKWLNAEKKVPELFGVISYLFFAPIMIYGIYVFWKSRDDA